MKSSDTTRIADLINLAGRIDPQNVSDCDAFQRALSAATNDQDLIDRAIETFQIMELAKLVQADTAQFRSELITIVCTIRTHEYI